MERDTRIATSSSSPSPSPPNIKHQILQRYIALLRLIFAIHRKFQRIFAAELVFPFESVHGRWAVKLQRPGLVSLSSSNPFCLSRMSIGNFTSSRKPFLLASAAGVAVNGTPPHIGDVEEMRAKLSGSLQDECNCDELIQSLHDSATTFELGLKNKISSSKLQWFSAAWLVLGVDTNAWVKTFSYQASVYSLLQAANEVSSRGNRRDIDLYVFVQRSLSRQAAPLDSVMRDKLSSTHPQANGWFWSHQVPSAVSSFLNCFERDQRFVAATSSSAKGKSSAASNEIDVSLLVLVLSCIAAVTKLGPTKLSCPPFSSMIPDTAGRLMDKLVDLVPLPQAYYSVKSIGLRREFLVHFGPRAAACRVKSDYYCSTDEVVFWVDLIQNQLLRAVDREKIWSRVATSESIEVLGRDLAIFGFFIALGRSTQSFLAANGSYSLMNPVEDLVRHFIGGSLQQYPQLSAIRSYHLYVEVVCEELEWLPFYPNKRDLQPAKQAHGHKSRPEGPPSYDALPQIFDVCSYWLQSFIKYSKWPENPSNVKAAKFLSKGHNKLIQCKEVMGRSSLAEAVLIDMNALSTEVSSSVDKALESVDEALVRLESLLQQLNASSSASRNEEIKAACSDLEKIRKLKKETEFLEASFRAKAASLQEGQLASDKISCLLDGPSLVFPSGLIQSRENNDSVDSGPNEIYRFELLRNELIELEKRVQGSTNESVNEVGSTSGDPLRSSSSMKGVELVQISKKGRVIKKIKETSTDVWQGTQLLGSDSAAAMELLRRSVIGDELTEKEKKALRRTVTDLASVLPIGVLMILPVTPVGHAAILAAIQRYVPGLIPSTYGSERLNLLRQLEQVKQMQNETESEEETETEP
ncbi:LETM1-like protein [Raphanus sativus]|nr:LETM1-like protein [Raphanus sativus]